MYFNQGRWFFFPTTHMNYLKYILISGEAFVIINGFDDNRALIIWMSGWMQRSKYRAGHVTVFAHDDSGRDRETALIFLIRVKSSQYEILHCPVWL